MSAQGVFLLITVVVAAPLGVALAVEHYRMHRAHRRLVRDLTTAAAQHAWDGTADHTDHSDEGEPS